MKKTKLAFLAMVPALLLASCGNGKEITDQQKIDDIKANITKKIDEIKNYEMTIKMDSNSYDGDEEKSINIKADIVYQVNENGEKYLKSTGTNDGVKGESTIYLVNNEQYQQVLYVSTYDPELNKNEVYVYGYEGNEMTFSFASFYFLTGDAYFAAFVDPNVIDFSKLQDASTAHEYDADVKYYSKGDDNLTIKADVKVKGEVDKNAGEYAVSSNYTVTYDKGYFKSAVIEGVSSKDNKSKTEVDLSVKNDIKIELPNGWEDLINKNNDGDLED